MNQITQQIVKQLQKKDVLTVDEIVATTKVARAEAIGELRRLQKKGLGILVIGRKGNPSRFVQKGDMEKKVEELWRSKHAKNATPATAVEALKVTAQVGNDWEVHVRDVKDNGDVILQVALPATEVGAFMGAVRRHKEAVH